MRPALVAVDERYQAAADVDIECHVLEWPTMSDAIRVLRDLRRAADEGVSRNLEDILAGASTWARLVSGTPLAPDALPVATSQLANAVRCHDETGLDSRLHPHLSRFAALLDALGDQPHPAAACLEEVISRYGRANPHDPPAVYIAVDADHAPLVKRWLEDEELDADVRAVTHLRDAPIRDALLLFGPPARYLMTPWCGATHAGRIGGWLLSAPPATHVHIVTWPGHLPLDPDTINVFPTTLAPTIRTSRRGSNTPERDDEPVWLPPTAVEPRVTPAGSWLVDRDPVAATGFRLAGDHVVFYAVDGGDVDGGAGPAPEILTWDGNAVHVTDAEPGQIRVGTVLLFRPLRSATDDELHRRADALLVGKYGPGAPAAAKAAKAELKEALATSGRTDRQLHTALSAALHNSGYARHVLNCVPYPGYIAPEKAGAYQAFRSVLGLPEDDGGRSDRLLRELRTACRRAGIDIIAELISILRATTSWQPNLETFGYATVSGGPLLGELDLRVVVAVDPAVRYIGRSHLGQHVPASGGAHGPAVMRDELP
jgi:hypothetical protein